MRISIVVPCYNSEHTIEKLVDLCMEEFDHKDGWECEMVLVNDFSRDGTFEAIKRAAAKYPDNVRGVNLAKNFGQHCALMCGFGYVTGDVVAGIDDDLQNHPAQIKELLAKMEEGYDVVFGKYKKRNFSFFKNITGAVSQFLLFHLIDRPKDIEMSAFWVARRYVIEEVKKYKGTDPFVQLLFVRTTRRLADVEVEHYAREVGTSNYTFRKGLKLFMSFINFSTIPLQIANVLGTLFSVVGFIGALVVLIRKLLDPTIAVGWSSLMCIVLILSGIVLLMLGIIGAYVGKLINTATSSPTYVVRETTGFDGNTTPDLPGNADKQA